MKYNFGFSVFLMHFIGDYYYQFLAFLTSDYLRKKISNDISDFIIIVSRFDEITEVNRVKPSGKLFIK